MTVSNASQQNSIASVGERVRPVAIGTPVGALYFIGDRAAFVGDEETITLVSGDGEKIAVTVHGGAILSSVSDGTRIVTGGDDGKVVALDMKGERSVLVTDEKRRWIDNVALHPDGTLAWSAGKTAFVRGLKGEDKSLEAPSSVGGLAFAPKGLRLALAHYNGVSLWFPNMTAKPERLEWAGSHLGVAFSPDSRFLITTMHESALHGWRLADAQHMQMTGYPSRVKSMSWGMGGKFLATSGADRVVVWPFASKDGPMDKEPAMLAQLEARVTAVACHPTQDFLAAGYDNGTILMVRLTNGAKVVVRRDGAAPVAALAWNAKGSILAFALQNGDAGLVDL
ncbi:WD40 repeat domain-containing protein [Nitrobacter sp. NHB1]|uniref:WD40 repeat domain-containing protein n=1 Tax=Nitrobacter sp. NHB1 TaxID=3119830 RepID=UPI002FFFE1FC